MIGIMFICHGNICRSPMAEFVMKDLVKKAGLEDEFVIASSAVSAEELGNHVYPPAKKVLEEHGISVGDKHAELLTRRDYDLYDLLIAMDTSNLRNIDRIIRSDPEGKVHLLMSYAGKSASVADPWYTGDFETAYNDIREGCEGLLRSLTQGRK
ncbi:MAG: low molecular weight phosphotyrosine protein phosphatase [Ruminococcus sp.]|uniref:low molecular weight protein-tyrosine-phosphatase n=1 Tax=Ruminococcus sp. TaxID=41978 RepID=UPI0025CD9169|nr:low molecular weight protein-tyrosine-phosphatase [Ruminococcus sp.]MBQ9543240.1 low molecular weight phosphotyrosine protein phosphatase [Ruminococcus sp.]MBR0528763.1 low molecular weight phosphotyrosine protein phosphatase [Ruminococcus sp.]